MSRKETDVLIIGGGIGGLVLALSLHQVGIDCRIYESVAKIEPLGAGINLLPHAVRELDELGLLPALDRVGIRTRNAAFFNRFGQHIYTEPAGEAAGYPWPQFSIHRGDLQMLLLEAVHERLGPDAVVLGRRCTGTSQTEDTVTAHFVDADGNASDVVATLAVGADGLHSALRKQFYPDEGEPVYSGTTIWRGTTVFEPFLSGADTARIGWLSVGKLMVYPIRDNVDGEGRQLMNWVASLERPRPASLDWNKQAKLEDFFEPFSNWHFDWLDAPKLLTSTERPLIFPMVDRDPVPTWTFGRATLLGDAAHPMYPRGSNGAGQAILDARFLTGRLRQRGVNPQALQEYDGERVKATAKVVLTNRKNPPDAILREVYERTGDKPFGRIEEVIDNAELQQISQNYSRVAGFEIEQLKNRASYV